MAEQEARIRVRNLWKVFGSHQNEALRLAESGKTREETLKETGATVALKDVSFDVYDGEIFMLMGLSGCGKSTLLRCLNRLIPPTRGEIHVGGTNVMSLDRQALKSFRRKSVGMVFQHFALFPHRTVVENVAFGLEIQGMGREERIAKAREALDMVKLTEWADAMPDNLSGGMRQRVGVARALAIEPDVLLMDEPFSALDPLIRSGMQDDILDIRDKLGKTMVFVTHDLDEALTLGDRIAIMNKGEVLQVGAPADIAVRPDSDFVERFVSDINKARVLKAEDLMRPSVLTLRRNESPKAAVRRMDDKGWESAFVVDREKHLVGYISLAGAVLAVKAGSETIESHVQEAFTVTPDSRIEDLVHPVIERRQPAAVVDESNHLLGVVRIKDLLPAFTAPGTTDSTDETVEA